MDRRGEVVCVHLGSPGGASRRGDSRVRRAPRWGRGADAGVRLRVRRSPGYGGPLQQAVQADRTPGSEGGGHGRPRARAQAGGETKAGARRVGYQDRTDHGDGQVQQVPPAHGSRAGVVPRGAGEDDGRGAQGPRRRSGRSRGSGCARHRRTLRGAQGDAEVRAGRVRVMRA